MYNSDAQEWLKKKKSKSIKVVYLQFTTKKNHLNNYEKNQCTYVHCCEYTLHHYALYTSSIDLFNLKEKFWQVRKEICFTYYHSTRLLKLLEVF